MKTSGLITATGLALIVLSPAGHAQQSVTDSFDVTFQMDVLEAVSFTIDGDLVIEEKSDFDTYGFQEGCIGLNMGPDFEVSMTSSSKPQGTEYFYLQGAGDSYLRYHLTLQSFTDGETATYWNWSNKSGETRQNTVPDIMYNNFGDRCESDVTFRLKASIWDDIHPTADPDAGAGQNVFQGSDALRLSLPVGSHNFSDTVTITLAPVLGTS